MTVYHCTMSNGSDLDVSAESAADAIQDALDRVRGARVIFCYAGNKKNGCINYEIPRHDPLPYESLRPAFD